MRWFSRSERKVLCSIGAGAHEELLALTGKTFRSYAERHGYDLDLRTELVAKDRPASWSKVRLILDDLESYDVAFWIDADAMIVDDSVDVTTPLDGRSLGMVAHEIDGQRIPNFGVWVARGDRPTRRFLEQVWAQTQYVEHRWWENAAVLHLLGYELEPQVRQLRHTRFERRIAWLGTEWNSLVNAAAASPRIVHYPGHDQEARLQHLGAWLARVEAARESAGGERTLS